MINALAVGAGGFIGAMLRYLISVFFVSSCSAHICIGTFIVNFTGCFLIGLLAQFEFKDFTYMRYFLIAGLLGGFTTFSAFGFETLTFLKEADHLKAFLYVTSTLALCLLAVYLGSMAYKQFN